MKKFFKKLFFLAAFFMLPNLTNAATLWSQNFNLGTTGMGFPHDGPENWVRMTSGGPDNSAYMRLSYTASNVGTDGNQMMHDVSSLNINAFWVKMSYRVTTQDGDAHGGSKFLKLFAEGGINGANNITLIMSYSVGDQTSIRYYNDTLCEPNYNGTMPGGCPGPNPTWVLTTTENMVVRDGAWHVYKAYVKRADPGLSNGEIRVFRDGTEFVHMTNMATNPTEVWPNSTKFVTFSWGDYTASHESDWTLDFDNIVIADTDPDVSSDTTPPASPSGLSVS